MKKLIEKMNNMSEAEISAFAQTYHKKLEKEYQEKIDFWDSVLCQRMISDIISSQNSFAQETFLYFPEEIQELYQWEDISKEQISLFIQVMADNTIGIEEDSQITIDEECMFDNFTLHKKGIDIFVMMGQGSHISISPSKSLEINNTSSIKMDNQ